jgi:hypothetical protein
MSVPASGLATDTPAAEAILYPEGFAAYQAYLDLIGGRPRQADEAIIEATVESLQRSELCPYPDEGECRVEPYPSDWGVVRIDKLVSYTPYAVTVPASPQEGQASGNAPQGETSPQYRGPESQPTKQKTGSLDEGQAVQALFLLTTRPAKARYLPASASEGTEAMLVTEPGAGDTVAHSVEPGEAVFNPIPREGQYYVFTAGIGDYAAPVEVILPGLEVGDKFRAKIRYDGVLYVEAYELVP